MEPDMLTKENAPRKPHWQRQQRKNQLLFRRDTTSLHDLPVMPKARADIVSIRNMAEAARACPCDEMHVEHHRSNVERKS